MWAAGEARSIFTLDVITYRVKCKRGCPSDIDWEPGRNATRSRSVVPAGSSGTNICRLREEEESSCDNIALYIQLEVIRAMGIN